MKRLLSRFRQGEWGLGALGFSPGVLLAIGLTGLIIYASAQYLQQSFQQRVTETAHLTAKGVSSLIAERLQNYHLVLRSVANHHQDRIFELAAGGGYPYDFTQVSADIYTLFSEVNQFAIIDAHGRARLKSPGSEITQHCQAQIDEVLKGTYRGIEAELHRGQNGYHFDVIVKMMRGQDVAALFVSFSLEHLQKLLAQFETSELRLQLLDHDPFTPMLINGGGVMPFSASDNAVPLAEERVSHTLWQLQAVPENGLFARYAQRVNTLAVLLFLAFSTLFLIFTHYRRAAQQAWVQAQKKASYSALFNAGPTVLVEKDFLSGMAIEYVSPNVVQLTGFTDSQLMGERSFYELIHPDDLAQFKQRLERAIGRHEPSFEMEYRLMTSDWDYVWVYSLLHLNRNREGRVTKIQAYITSIQAQKLAEQQAITLIENAPDAMVVTDVHGEIVSVNKMAETLFAAPKEALLQQSLERWIPAYHLALGHGQPHEKSSQRECVATRLDGRKLTLSISFNRLQTPGGALVASVLRDISLDKAAQEQMILAKERAESLAVARSQFIAMVSHEIRTPMNGVLGMAELLADTPLDARQQTYLQAIRESGRSLVSILNDVLDFSKLDKGGIRLRPEPFALPELVRNVLQLMRPEAKLGEVALQLQFDAECPRQVVGDGLRLRQILLNLVGNAIKFSPKGRVTLEVYCRCDNPPWVTLQFKVVDNGIGIAPADQKRLFEPFVQADSSHTRHFGGTGLGLAICKQLVDLMGGSITLQSALGEGSTFSVELVFKAVEALSADDVTHADLPTDLTVTIEAPPAEALAAPVSAPASESRAASADLPALRKVLLVEDDAVNQQIAQAFLENLGLQVDSLNNGLEALEYWRLHHQELVLILMDCQMPIMDGYEACRLIRREERLLNKTAALPIIAFTANAYEQDRERCLQAGMSDLLVKPLYAEEFNATLLKWLEKSG